MDRAHHLGQPMIILLPEGGKGPGVVVAHAWWGLNQAIRDYGAKLAKEGFVVGLPDLFDGQIADTIEGAEQLADTDWSPNAGERLRDAIMALAAHEAVTGDKVAAVGFSYSGWHLFGLANAPDLPLSRLVIHYATRQIGPQHVPMLVHFAQNDPFESGEDMAEVTKALTADGPPNAAYTYPGTRHWFVEPDRPEYDADEAAVAWERTLGFLKG
ncbi:MAG: dienelactone hydrolase family protein [Hyphomicrobiales bacterium]|nr:MAG: dienelactone hydrolase family protein [Hyphomicrobiales bacterium]